MSDLRHLSSLDDLAGCVRLQRTTWGERFRDVVPASLLQVSQKVGGLLAGAFEDERMLGFVYSLAGRYGGEAVHWSHMLAVHPDARGRGLGRRLKLFQRTELLAAGTKVVYWTFDPLVARNAHLNLNRLGASVVDYVENMYGDETGSPLHAGGETDRLIVRWDLDSQRARWAVQSDAGATGARPLEEDEIVRPEIGLRALELPEGDEVFVEIPPDHTSLADTGPDPEAWRQSVRRALTTYLRRGYAVQSLRREQSRNRCFYFLRRL